MTRRPVVAGQFYPGSAAQLRAMIEQMVDEKAAKEDVIGLVSPHAGYPYSGTVAGATISRVKFRDTFIIMGPNHTGRGKPLSIMRRGKWATPLGEVEIDTELAERLLAVADCLQEDEVAHQFEHRERHQGNFRREFLGQGLTGKTRPPIDHHGTRPADPGPTAEIKLQRGIQFFPDPCQGDKERHAVRLFQMKGIRVRHRIGI